MEQLFSPHGGLMVWTVVTFLVLVVLMARFAWGPILRALDAREEGIRNNIRAAESSRQEAEDLRKDYEGRLGDVEARTRDLLAQAEARARAVKEDMVRAAQEESEKLLETSRKKLAEEERRLARELRDEMAELSVKAAEKILRRGMDKAFQERLLEETLADFEKWAGARK